MVIIGGKISKPNEDSGRATRRFQKGIFQEQACCVMYAAYSRQHIIILIYDMKITLCQSQI